MTCKLCSRGAVKCLGYNDASPNFDEGSVSSALRDAFPPQIHVLFDVIITHKFPLFAKETRARRVITTFLILNYLSHLLFRFSSKVEFDLKP